MFVQQLYTNCLSEAAYYIESDGECAIIDPLRDYREYINLAKDRNSLIKYVFETHFHADFVSGHIDLANKSNSKIVFGPNTETNYPINVAKDGEIFKVGKISIQAIHTPGHTPNSTCYLLKNEVGEPYCVFTGDTLFVGDVGRPDLFGENITKEDLAGQMFESLKKLTSLPDNVIVYPAHGPGSSCGKNLGKETFSTIGEQKKLNYALQEKSKEGFIKSITDGLTSPPQYFPFNASLNKTGYDSFDKILSNNKALDLNQFENEIKSGSIILDVRHQDDFEKGFIKGSVFIGLDGRFAEWVGTLFNIKQSFVLITPEGKKEETIIRMSRVGYENVKGYLKGGYNTWRNSKKDIDMIISIDNEELELDIKHDKIIVIDVRKESEFVDGHIYDAKNIVLQSFESDLEKNNIDKTEKLYIHCQGGYRSMIAASLFRKKGYNNIRNIIGGYNEIKKSNIKLVTDKVVA